MKIDQMKEGECGVIKHVGGGPDFQRRITAVGITPGSRFEIVQNIRKYPILLHIRSTMLAIDRTDSRMIEVEA